ncbi:MAG TPA: hypothetical protein VMO20_00680, partial [Candidatus Acidoferrum sp.]|nr:hypothetical protein [Candidatus Acidoferrum sp.]
SGSNKRNFAAAFEKSNKPAYEQQDNVAPENDIIKSHPSKNALIGLSLQVKNFAVLAFCNDIKGAAADFAIGAKALARQAGIHGDFVVLAAKRAGYCFRNFHAGV